MSDDIRPVGFTGTRRGMTREQREKLSRLLQTQWLGPGTTLHHGDADGADREAAVIAKRLGYQTVAHLPAGHEPEDYLLRNAAIVDACDELIAAPAGMQEERRSGTWATVRYARKVRRMTTVIWPDGTVSFRPDGLPSPAHRRQAQHPDPEQRDGAGFCDRRRRWRRVDRRGRGDLL